MDFSLPKIDGLTATRQIRELAMHGETPIIFISAHTEAAVRDSALAAGADDFLTKPVDFGELEEALDTHSKNKNILKQQVIGGVL
jgi:two-component system sensor histidine kinase BarA